MATVDAAAIPAGCPPSDASPRTGVFYHFVRGVLNAGDTTEPTDWEIPYLKRKGDCAGCPERCECHAHSLFTDIEELRKARLAIPWSRKKAIASIELNAGMGVLKQTQSDVGDSHHDWWPSDPGMAIRAPVVEGAEQS